MNYENGYEYEQEIDLKELFFSILYRWRPIIFVAVVFGLLLGGYKVARGLYSQQNAEAVAESREQYELDMAAYERNIASYTQDIETLQKSIENQEIYNEDSVLMKIDPYHKPRASADLLVKLDETEWAKYPDGLAADPTDSLVRMYASNLVQQLDWSGLEKQTGSEALYLKELVSVGTDYSSNMITLEAIYQDEETAELILDEIISQMEDRYREYSSMAGAHTIHVVNQNVGTITDTGLEDRQTQIRDRVAAYQKNLEDKKNALKELEEPTLPAELSKKKVAKEGIKFALIGGVGGAFLVAFYFCMIYVLSGKVHTDEELKDRFGIKILGVFSLPVKTGAFSSIDRWLERLEGKAVRPGDQEVLERIGLNIRNYAGSAKKVLITGTVMEDRLEELAGLLSELLPDIQLIPGGDMNQDPDTLRLLAESEAVVLVEEREVSKYQKIQKEKEAIDALKKPVLGCVIL